MMWALRPVASEPFPCFTKTFNILLLKPRDLIPKFSSPWSRDELVEEGFLAFIPSGDRVTWKVLLPCVSFVSQKEWKQSQLEGIFRDTIFDKPQYLSNWSKWSSGSSKARPWYLLFSIMLIKLDLISKLLFSTAGALTPSLHPWIGVSKWAIAHDLARFNSFFHEHDPYILSLFNKWV